MAEQIRDYVKLAEDIIQVVGGEKNIVSATRCATRLRLVLKETPKDAHEKIAAMPAVITVVEKGGQFQIVIGTHVGDVFDAMSRELNLEDRKGMEVEDKQSILNRVIATMSAVFAPFIYILAAAGLIQGCLIIIKQFVPTFTQTGVYEVISFISWTPFTFLPLFIAVTASKRFKCNLYIALACCAALVNPSWAEIVSRIESGETVKFMIFNLTGISYTSTILPPLFLVLVLSYLERFLEKKLPDKIKEIGTPFLCMIIMVPASLLVIGPISEVMASGLSSGYNFLYQAFPILAAACIGGLWQVVVIFGVHWAFTPMILSNFSNFGSDSFQVMETCAVVAQAAAAFGVFVKTRNKEFKKVAFSAGLTGAFGITEPAIYGVTLRLKKPFICGCIAGAIGAAVAGLFNSMYYVYAGLPGVLTVVNAINPDNPTSFIGIVIGGGIAIAIAFILVQIVGFEDPMSETDQSVLTKQEKFKNIHDLSDKKEIMIYNPVKGEIKELKEVNDSTFSGGMLGQGLAIIPVEGKVYAPIDGKIASIYESKHAVVLENEDGIELLIHIGLDTVSLGGKHFEAKVRAGDTVRAGDLLVEFNLDEIKKEFDVITPVLVLNPEDFSGIQSLKVSGMANEKEPLFCISKQ